MDLCSSNKMTSSAQEGEQQRGFGYDFNENNGYQDCFYDESQPLIRRAALSSMRNEVFSPKDKNLPFNSMLLHDDSCISLEREFFEVKTRRITYEIAEKQKKSETSPNKDMDYAIPFQGIENNSCSIVGTRPKHWSARKPKKRNQSKTPVSTPITDKREKNVTNSKDTNSSLSKATLQRISIPTSAKKKVKTNLLAAAVTLPAPTPHKQQKRRRTFFPTFMKQEETNSSTTADLLPTENTEKEYSQMRSNELLQELHSIQDKIQQDMKKLQQRIPIHHDFIDVEILDSGHVDNFFKLGFIHSKKQKVWIHLNTLESVDAGQFIRIYNPLFINNDLDKEDVIPMVTCTQLWQFCTPSFTFESFTQS